MGDKHHRVASREHILPPSKMANHRARTQLHRTWLATIFGWGTSEIRANNRRSITWPQQQVKEKATGGYTRLWITTCLQLAIKGRVLHFINEKINTSSQPPRIVQSVRRKLPMSKRPYCLINTFRIPRRKWMLCKYLRKQGQTGYEMGSTAGQAPRWRQECKVLKKQSTFSIKAAKKEAKAPMGRILMNKPSPKNCWIRFQRLT